MAKPRLRLDWNTDKQEEKNNRSRIRLRLYVVSDYTVRATHPESGSIDGNGFKYGGIFGSGSTLIRTQYIWINHNNSGAGSRRINAWYNLNITYSGSWIGQISTNITVTPPKIGRMSDFNSASVTGSIDRNGGATINLSITNKPVGFWHKVEIWDGTTRIESFPFTMANPSNYSIDATLAKKILNRMRTTTSKGFTIRVGTYTGNNSGKIGHKNKSVTIKIDSSEKPVINSHRETIAGNGWDSKNGMFLEGVSKVAASFSGSVGFGAGVKKETFRMASVDYNGSSVTSDTVQQTGNAAIRYTLKNTRGEEAVVNDTVYIEPYEPPVLDKFTAVRQSGVQSNVALIREGTWSNLNKKNKLKITARKQKNNGAWSPIVWDGSILTTGNANASTIERGVDIAGSFVYELTIKDDVGNESSLTVSVATAKVLLNFHEDKGLGIGKMHEEGVLDVDGDVRFRNSYGGETIRLISNQDNGYGFMSWFGNDFKRKGYIGFSSRGGTVFKIKNDTGIIEFDATDLYFNDKPIIETGSNGNGDFIKFHDGTLICTWGFSSIDFGISAGGFAGTKYSFAHRFSAAPHVMVTGRAARSGGNPLHVSMYSRNITNSTFEMHVFNDTASRMLTWRDGEMFAIGRWK